MFTSYVPALATLLAAFYGAKYAFEFQRNKETEEKRRNDVVNGNIAIFNLMSMTNSLYAFQAQGINPYRDLPAAFLLIPPVLHPIGEDIKIDPASLYFLLENSSGNLLGEIIAEQRKYITAVESIDERSRIHVNEVQPLLERAGIQQGFDYPLEKFEEALGPRTYFTIKHTTDQVVEHVDRTIISLQVISQKLADVLKHLYPKEYVLRYSLPKEQEYRRP